MYFKLKFVKDGLIYFVEDNRLTAKLSICFHSFNKTQLKYC